MPERWPDGALGEPVADHEPDPAALDELMRAFAGDAAARQSGTHETVAPDLQIVTELADAPDPTAPDTAPHPLVSPASDRSDQNDEIDEIDEVDEIDEIEVDEIEEPPDLGPGVAPAETSEPTAPAIIRIDDYAGSQIVGEGEAVDLPEGLEPAESGPPGERVVISIDDEELPDAVYIQGSLDGSRKESVVFIEDDDTGDAMVPESERDLRRGIEPRMRERRLAVRRAQGRKRLKWAIVIAVVLLLVVAALAVLGSGLFAVREDQVYVTGNVYTDEQRLAGIIDDLVGTPVLLVDTQDLERRIEEIPWVDEANVRTGFPHAASIEILERQAWSTYQGPDGRFRVLDPEGRVLDVLDGYPFAYVLLVGPDPVDLEPGAFAPRGYAAASEFAKNLTGSIRGQVEKIEVTADGSRLVLWLDDGTEVRFGEARDLIVKLVRLETVLATEEGREPGVIDVSTREVTL